MPFDGDFSVDFGGSAKGNIGAVDPLAKLGDFVWHDLDADGVQDVGEPGIEGVTVKLQAGGGITLATTTTDTDGMYMFSGLTPGVSYNVMFVQPSGFDSVSPLDAGLYNMVSLGDFVWHDLDADGIQDAGEPGIPNATVHLKDASGTVIDTTTTTTDGGYSFTGLEPGTYSVQFEPLAGFSQVSPLKMGGDDSVGSDADPSMNR